MSRAFVKEPDGDQAEDDLPDLPQSDEPNYITLNGFNMLQNKYKQLLDQKILFSAGKENLTAKTEVKQVERDLRYLKQRLERTIVVDPSTQSNDQIRFGATVTVLDEDDQIMQFTIVGEDETCAATGRISWSSPLGRALIGKQQGDIVYLERPVGNIELEIKSYQYEWI